jgi:putative ABC transport system substrate-binding protein
MICATGSTAAVQAAMAATQTIPIVFVIAADPVKFALVASLNRPSGNVTGVSFLVNLLVAKQLGLLHELIPGATNFSFLVNPNNPNAESDTNNARLAADALDRKIVVVKARTREDIDRAFTLLIQERADALQAPIRCSAAAANNWRVWRPITRCRPCSIRENLLWRADF